MDRMTEKELEDFYDDYIYLDHLGRSVVHRVDAALLITEIRACWKERDEFVGKGFWGRSCAKLINERDELNDEITKLKTQVEELQAYRSCTKDSKNDQ